MKEDELVQAAKEGDGILQSNIWKEFDIDSKKASRLVRELEKKGVIRRESVVANGSRTYMIKYNEEGSTLDSLFSGDMLSPCIGCSTECRPGACAPLAQWTTAE